MFSLSSIILAFFAGILGTLIGGTQTFICTGFVGLLIFLLEHVGVNTTFLNEALSNNLFLIKSELFPWGGREWKNLKKIN